MKTNLNEVISAHHLMGLALEALENEVVKRDHIQNGNEEYYNLFGKFGEKESDLDKNLSTIQVFVNAYNRYKEQLNNIQINITIPQKDDTH